MAELTDEEKAKAAFGDVDESKESDETAKNEEADANKEEDAAAVKPDEKAEEEPDKQAAEADSADDTTKQSLTKPYPWLKGDTPEQWSEELKKAYDNSTEEALKQKKRADDAEALIVEAKRVIANQGQAETSETASDSALSIDSHPALQYAKTLQEQSMIKDWGEFAKKYTQASEPDGFAQIEKAMPGASQAFAALNNRQPTYQELFEETAALLRWQPTDQKARKDAAIKETASSSQVTNSSAPTKKSNVSEEQLRVARRLFPNQSDEEIAKDLAQYINN